MWETTPATLEERYERLVHVFNELVLSDAEVLVQVVELFPAFDTTDDSFEDHVSQLFLAEYTEYRSVGLSLSEAAHKIGSTGILLTKMLNGEGVTLKTFVQLVEAELFAVAEFKYKHVSVLGKSADEGHWRASLALLERQLPGQFASTGPGSDADSGDPLEIVTYQDKLYEDVVLPSP